jgi:hypothetical protein
MGCNSRFCPLSPGERAGVREMAHAEILISMHCPFPLAPRPSPGQALPPRGEGNTPGREASSIVRISSWI